MGRQVARMLADPRARNLSESFGVQWLGLSSIDDQIKNNPIHLHAMHSTQGFSSLSFYRGSSADGAS